MAEQTDKENSTSTSNCQSDADMNSSQTDRRMALSALTSGNTPARQNVRKRVATPENWRCNKVKLARAAGQAYVSPYNGKVISTKSVQATKYDHMKCKLSCRRSFSADDQNELLKEYYALPHDSSKDQYLLRCITIAPVNSRRRSEYKGKRNVTWKYHLMRDNGKVAVCQEFFLCTFDINHSKLETLRKSLNDQGNPKPKSTHQPSTTIGAAILEQVRRHIESFPVVESHYCRSSIKRSYLEVGLSTAKMYQLYIGKMVAEDLPTVKQWKYNNIFTKEYNLGFHTPKKDRCDKCAEFEARPQDSITDKIRLVHERHIAGKEAAKQQRDIDLKNTDLKTIIVSFDLENVFALPRTTVSSAFYKQKLNTYNLTAVESRTKIGYCAIWTETTSGRSGNDLASAVCHLLSQILFKHTEAENIILWSDSCVAQNRNQILSYALQLFLQNHPSINSIIQRYCEPGHSTIQNADTLHSNIESGLKGQEIQSPVTLIRLLKAIRHGGREMHVHLMKPVEFKDYKAIATLGTYTKVGYATVKEIVYHSSDVRVLRVKRDTAGELETIRVLKALYLRGNLLKPIAAPKALSQPKTLSKAKAEDITSLIRYLTGVDKVYVTSIVENCQEQ